MNNLFWNSKKTQSLKDKVIVVTGGNSGLGFEDVKYYALRGASVVLACRNIEKGEKAKALIKNGDDSIKIDVMQLDLADLNSIQKFAESFKMKYSKLNILMNNAWKRNKYFCSFFSSISKKMEYMFLIRFLPERVIT
ncbi:MAG TPA: SDR family NAD(P)-dependent oxidoreductase [Lachnospiraceae bacterium]|nr:SDR family NAD(P)-dependent oxidoreductase [Lachnospiraceae bacterium]